jgi:hypothetical protein
MAGRDAEQDVFRRHAASVSVSPRLSSLGRMNTMASWAEPLAQVLLQEPLPRRWAHVQGVAAQARGLAAVLGADADLLEATAWLHDIGYAPGLAATGLHSLDGAHQATADPLTLIVSGDIYRSVVRHGYDGIDQSTFHPLVRVQIAGDRYVGWIRSSEKATQDRVAEIVDYRRPA